MEITKLEQAILDTRNSLSTDRLDMSFGEIMSMYEREELIISPDFQRLFRWSNYQKTRFIESLLLGIPIPPIFVAEDNNGKWELVDGLQRLSTVLSFFGLLKADQEKNNWEMNEGDLISALGGYDAKNIPMKFLLNIKRSVCRIEIIKWNSKIDMRYELFNRLNTGGSPLADQEIRNCIFRGISSDFNDFLKRGASQEALIHIVEPTERQKSHMYLEELVLRFATLFNTSESIKKDNLSAHMTEYMQDVIKNNSFDYSVETLFYRVINILGPLGKDSFRFDNGIFSASLFDAITIGVASDIESYENEVSLLARKISEIKESEEFRKYTGSASNNKSRVTNRIRIAKQIFKVE